MTRTSRKYSENATNGRSSASNGFQIEPQTPATHDSPSDLLSSQNQIAVQALKPEATETRVQTQRSPLQQQQAGLGFFGSLRTKAMLLALAIGTLPVILVGTTAYLAADRGIKQQIFENEQTNARYLGDKLNAFINQQYENTVVMSNLNVFSVPKVWNLFTIEEKNAILNRYRQNFRVYDSIAIADLKGNVLYRSEGEVRPNIFDRDYFQVVLKTDRPTISNPQLSTTTKIFSFFITAPIKNKVTGKTVGIIRGRIPMSVLQEVIGVDEARGQEFYLVNLSNDQITVATNPESLQKKLESEFPELLIHKQKGDQSLTTTFTHNADKREEIVTYVPNQTLKEVYNLNWGLLASRPVDVAFAPQRQLLLTLLLGTGIVILLVGLLATMIANRATRPILDAVSAVDKIGQGELDTRLEVQGEDEIALLGANINEMAIQLQSFLQAQALATEQARLLAEVTGFPILDASALQDIFSKALSGTRAILQLERVVLYRFNSNGSGEITVESVASGWPRSLDQKIQDPCIPKHLLAAYKEGRVVPTNDVSTAGFHPDHLKLMERLKVKANLVVPILSEGELFGLLIAHQCLTPHDWQPTEINFLQQLAAQLGTCLDRLTLLELEQTEKLATEQRQLKEGLQKRAMELLMEVDPIAQGDLTIRAKVTEDEIGTIADSYNATVSSLRKIVTQVQSAASLVTQTTSSNSVSVQTLSQEALRQAEEIAVALRRIQDMAQSVRLVAANAQQAEVAAQQARQTVAEGDAAMNRTVEGILAIRETVAATAKKVKHLGESSQKISIVVNLISTFAAQTNLLAFNASLEANRAGEEGRGFAVVAEEVRVLARQSAAATIEIEKLVAGIQAETNEVVAAMEAGSEQVVTGTKLVDETRASLTKITAASAEINQLVAAIAQATVVQSQASEAVTQTMTNVAAIADHTSTEAILVSSAFEQLRAVAEALQADVGQFKVS